MEPRRALLLLMILFAAPAWANPAEVAANVAQRYEGTPYLWGGATPAGFDCSGLVQFAYAEAGIPDLPRTVTMLQSITRPVTRTQLRKGDLLFFTLRNGRRPHVGIYLGDGQFIHARSRGKQVTRAELDTPYWRQRFTGAGRIVRQN